MPQLDPQPHPPLRKNKPHDPVFEELSKLKNEILHNSGDIKRLKHVLKIIGDINNQYSSQKMELNKLKEEIEELKSILLSSSSFLMSKLSDE